MFRVSIFRFTALLICLLMAVSANSQVKQLLDLAEVREIPVWSPQQKAETTIGQSGKLNLLVLISPECPMSINYTLTLNQLQEQYARELSITGLIVGSSYSDETIKQFAASYKISYPLLVDRKKEIALTLKGEVTPEVYLFDQSGHCVYRGAIDNWLMSLGKKKQKPDRFYLADAIRQAVNGEPIPTAYVKAQGCALNEY